MTDYKPGEFLVVKGYSMMLRVHSLIEHNGKIRICAPHAGTFDTESDTLRRLRRGDVIMCWNYNIRPFAEVIAWRESDGYYLIVNYDDPEATSCYIKPNGQTRLRSVF